MSDHNTQAITNMTITPPVGDDSIDHLRRLEVVASVCLPAGYGFLVWLQTHITKFDSFRLHLTGLNIQDPSLQHAKGVVHLHYLKLRFSCYFNQQRKTSVS